MAEELIYIIVIFVKLCNIQVFGNTKSSLFILCILYRTHGKCSKYPDILVLYNYFYVQKNNCNTSVTYKIIFNANVAFVTLHFI